MGSILVQSSRSRTFGFVIRSWQRTPSREWKARMWKCSSCLTCPRYSIQVSHPYWREVKTTALWTISFVEKQMLWWLCTSVLPPLMLGLFCWSWMWFPSFKMMLPRYLKLSTFASGVSLVLMFGPTGGVWSKLVQYLGLAEADSQPEGLRRLLDLLICRLLSLCARRAQSSANRASWISWCQHFVFAFRRWRSKREQSRRYLISSMSCTACASLHVEKRLNRSGASPASLHLRRQLFGRRCREPVLSFCRGAAGSASQTSLVNRISPGPSRGPPCWLYQRPLWNL